MASRRFLISGVLVLAAAAVLGYASLFAMYAFSPLKPGSQISAVIEIHKGQAAREVSKLLAANGAIADPEDFVMLGRLARKWKKIKTGEYKVSPGMSPMALFATLTSGVSVPHPLTVREGENMYEVAAALEEKGLMPAKTFLALCRDPKLLSSLSLQNEAGKSVVSLEGYLYPDTYFFNKTMAPEEMVRQMVRRFQQVWTDKESARARELGMSRHQLVILASMIEKETGAPQERPMISSVFYNRLRKKMRLQSDPTTIYGIWERYKGNIHKSDLLNPTPYNTYTVPALPVGPIGNPGKDAIQAALYPAQSEFLFFVSHNDGTHEFTKTFADHSQAVRKFQLDPKARQGKSWRDLSKQNHSN